MNERDWMARTDVHQLLNWLYNHPGGPHCEDVRRLRLYGCACVRLVNAGLGLASLQALDRAERYADGEGSADEANASLARWPEDSTLPSLRWPMHVLVRPSLAVGLCDLPRMILGHLARGNTEMLEKLAAEQKALLLDLYGNVYRRPACTLWQCNACGRFRSFRSAPASPSGPGETQCNECGAQAGRPFEEWCVPSVRALARGAYDSVPPSLVSCPSCPGSRPKGKECVHCYNSRFIASCDPGHLENARLQVLADYLEDEARCTDSEVLEHLRSPGPHVRGCWALDLFMDKDLLWDSMRPI